MYANINEYLGMYSIPKSNLLNKKEEHETFSNSKITENFVSKYDLSQSIPKIQNTSNILKTQYTQSDKANPKVWGPSYWYTLHTSAAFYPLEANPIVKDRMKNRILAIPYEIPCSNCRIHAINFIEKHRDGLDKIVSGRHELGAFYVDFHNQVNKRYNKPLWTYEQAYKLYSGENI